MCPRSRYHPQLEMVGACDALTSVLAFKHPLAADAEPQRVLLVDLGHTHFSVAVALMKADDVCGEASGALQFQPQNISTFEHF